MDITLEKASDTNASLKITLTPADYKPEVDKKLKDYGKKVQLKGFRPGHVPTSLVQKMYGKSILVDEINSMLSRTVSQYIRENKLQVVGDPVPNRDEAEAIDWDNQTDFAFSYTLGLASEFSIDFADLPSVTRYEIQAGESEIDSTIADLQQRFHGHAHGEEVGETDTIYGELKQTTVPEGAEPFSAKTAFPMDKMDEGAKGQFVGRRKGDEVIFILEDAFSDEKARANATGVKKEEAANLTGEFSFIIDDITRHEPAELNQEFFDKVLGVGAVQDEEQFRAKVAEIIRGNYAREADQLLRLDIEKTLIDNTPILLPDEFLKNWLLETNEGKFTKEQVEEQYDEFAKSVKLQLIKNKVADSADINVEFAEVLDVTRQMVREQFGFTGGGADEEMDKTIDRIARNYLMDEKNNGQNYTSTFNRVYDDKVIEYAKTQMTIVSQEITVDEFKALVENR